jgi:hypothetical protein
MLLHSIKLLSQIRLFTAICFVHICLVLAACFDGSDSRPANEHILSVMANHFHSPMDWSDALEGETYEEQLALRAEVHFRGVRSDHFGRIGELANRVDKQRPDILLMHGAQDPQFTGPVVDAEALQNIEMMMAALDARGLSYSIIAERDNDTYPTVPLVSPACELSVPVGACTTTPKFKDYVLVNNDNKHLVLTNVESNQFVNYLQLPPINWAYSENLYKGWITIEGMIGERPFRVVDVYYTRANFLDFQVLQTQELIAGPLQYDGALIVSVNSKSSGTNDPTPTSTGYPILLATGLTDTWQDPNDPGYTCCQNYYLDNSESKRNRRDDYILVNDLAEPVEVSLLGTTPFQNTPPYWAGTHAASYVEVQIKASRDE